mmetsp:Transcript_25589/g.32599  ORF Transcript_25589/g.32599 Transcript_25589/m.32599 type:complete len:103 (-) Transcript_25589:229-537(-)
MGVFGPFLMGFNLVDDAFPTARFVAASGEMQIIGWCAPPLSPSSSVLPPTPTSTPPLMDAGGLGDKNSVSRGKLAMSEKNIDEATVGVRGVRGLPEPKEAKP